MDVLQKYFLDIVDRPGLRNVRGILLLISSAAIWRIGVSIAGSAVLLKRFPGWVIK